MWISLAEPQSSPGVLIRGQNSWRCPTCADHYSLVWLPRRSCWVGCPHLLRACGSRRPAWMSTSGTTGGTIAVATITAIAIEITTGAQERTTAVAAPSPSNAMMGRGDAFVAVKTKIRGTTEPDPTNEGRVL